MLTLEKIRGVKARQQQKFFFAPTVGLLLR